MNEIIHVENLTKRYGGNPVLNGISFTVNRGEIFALLGTNGAGKTTTLECIEGIRKYDSGNIKVNGKVGVQLQSSSLPANIKVIEAYRLFCAWNHASENPGRFKTFGLNDVKNKQYRELSTGQKRRLHLILALIHLPDIIFLDEPTAGLDVEGRVMLHAEIRKLREQGKTIMLASHDMAEVESLCDRVAILREGELAYLGSAGQLTRNIGSDIKICIKTASEMALGSINSARYEGMEQDYHVFITTDLSVAILELFTALRQADNKVLDVKIDHPTLEQQFMSIAREGRV